MLKRTFDIFFSSIGLIFLSPIFLIFILMIFLQDFSNPFYRAPRVGKNGKIFTMVKLRSMIINADKNKVDSTASDDMRITRVGMMIRAYKLDELTQLINVLKGDMSLVGPRPLLVKYLPLYTSEEKKRHNVKPGITGWAQINGRNTITWKKKFQYDLWYVENQTFFLDLKIFSS